MPANPIREDLNCEDPKERSISTIVRPAPEDLCIVPSEGIITSPRDHTLMKSNTFRLDKSSGKKNTSPNDKQKEDDKNNSRVFVAPDNSEKADFVYPPMYKSSLNVIIK